MMFSPEDPRMCVVFFQTPAGVERAYVVMDFRRRALRRRRFLLDLQACGLSFAWKSKHHSFVWFRSHMPELPQFEVDLRWLGLDRRVFEHVQYTIIESAIIRVALKELLDRIKHEPGFQVEAETARELLKRIC